MDPNQQENTTESIERVRLERELYWRLLELGHTKDATAFLQEGLSLICGVTSAEKGYLVLYSPERPDDPLFWAERGFSQPELPLVQRKLSTGIISAALATGETILLNSAQEDPRFNRNQSVTEQEIKAVLCAPIGGPPPLGVLYLQGCKTGPFSEADRRCAEAFARQTAPMVDRLLTQQGREANQDQTKLWRQRLKLERLIGKSRALAEIFRQIESAARFEITVMLVGASGTGKNEVARALHDNSTRSTKPFLKLSCADLSEAFFEETPPEPKNTPHFSDAQGGTLFLDGLGELSLPIQGKLLRLLQSKEEGNPNSDLRILTSTNADLRSAVKQKTFREDLFYHLGALQLQLPTLAERREDILLLAEFFCERICRRHRLTPLALSNAAVRALEMLEWPGNVRQLLLFIEAATLRASVDGSAKIEHQHLFPQESAQEKTSAEFLTFQEATRRFQKQFLEDLLRVVDWNIPEAARRLDLARTHVYHLIQGFSLQHPKKKREPSGA